jgi:uncharacterized protein YndB with AHSA1/START domain
MSQQPAYSVEREIDIPVDILWAAWTDPDALAVWYHGIGHSVVPGSVLSDAVPGCGQLQFWCQKMILLPTFMASTRW